MNKILGLLWTLSLLITFYLGYSYKSQSSELTSSNRSILTENALLVDNENIKNTVVTSSKKQTPHNNNTFKVAVVSMNETLDEIKSILGNGMDMASIAKAYNLINTFSKQELEQALAQLENTANDKENLSLLSILLSKYAEENVQASLAYIEEHLTSKKSKESVTLSVIRTWTKKDALAAYYWFINQNGSKGIVANNSNVLNPIFAQLTKQDFQSAFDRLIELSHNSRSTYSAVTGMTKVFTTKAEFSELMERTNELADRRLKDNVVHSWVTRDPQEAIEWIETVEDSEERSKLQEKVLRSWIRSEPTAAANWYLDKAEPKVKQRYADNIIVKWSREDPETALNWLNQQTEIDQGQSTIKLLQSSVYGNTDFVINNLHLVSNDKDMLNISNSIHRSLARNNPKKAAEFVEQSTVKEALQKNINRYRKYKAKRDKG
ncbi:hypothetical protein [Colwellia sp. 75C3]|uniref:hypothetical protein n=1 Tax=Colwellia sp. 75C3 TaxID=888425 RepID=UPI000C33F22F|nr:hypothetical protein [Colwellia sp. 75C3]